MVIRINELTETIVATTSQQGIEQHFIVIWNP